MTIIKKLTLTKEQGNAIEELKDIWKNSDKDKMNGILIREKINGGWMHKDFKAANELSHEDFINALLFGYEVEVPKTVEDEIVEALDDSWQHNMYTNKNDWDVGYNRGWVNGVYRILKLLKNKKDVDLQQILVRIKAR